MTTYNRPGARVRIASATRSRLHYTPACEGTGSATIVGMTQKTQQPSSAVGFSGNAQITIGVAEPFTMIVKGVVQVPFITSSVQGSTVWINETNDVLTLTDPGSSHGHKFGKVTDPNPSTPFGASGLMSVDLDAKDSF